MYAFGCGYSLQFASMYICFAFVWRGSRARMSLLKLLMSRAKLNFLLVKLTS
jgi:hypothetical protein